MDGCEPGPAIIVVSQFLFEERTKVVEKFLRSVSSGLESSIAALIRGRNAGSTSLTGLVVMSRILFETFGFSVLRV